MQSALGRTGLKATVRAGSWDTSQEALQGRQGCGDGLGRAKQRRGGRRDEFQRLRVAGGDGETVEEDICLLLWGKCWCYTRGITGEFCPTDRSWAVRAHRGDSEGLVPDGRNKANFTAQQAT